MTEEEVKAYIERIENTPLEDVYTVLPDFNTYNVDIIISKICDGLKQNINILRSLQKESLDDELSLDILDLLKKLYVCTHYLDVQSTYEHDRQFKGHKVVFAKTAAGNSYFNVDLAKVPSEAYPEVSKVLDYIINGVDMSDNTKVKFYTNSGLLQKVLEFKGFQVRIYTTKLKGNVLCVFGLNVKKADSDKKISTWLKTRLTFINKQIEELRKGMNNPELRAQILEEGELVLADVRSALGSAVENSDDVELLFPSDEELESMVPYEDISLDEDVVSEVLESAEEISDDDEGHPVLEVKEDLDGSKEVLNVDESVDEQPSLEVQMVSNENNSVIPSTSKKVKRRVRGLGKKTIIRDDINKSLKGLSLEDLIKVRDYVVQLKRDSEIGDAIGDMYEGFYNMSAQQIADFENSIKYFKNDDIGRHK